MPARFYQNGQIKNKHTSLKTNAYLWKGLKKISLFLNVQRSIKFALNAIALS